MGFLVRIGGGISISGFETTASPWSIATLPLGRTAAVWASNTGGITGTIVNADGSTFMAPFTINQTVTGLENNPEAEGLVDGRLLVGWEANRGAPSGQDLVGRILSLGGVSSGEFVISNGPSVDGSLSLAAKSNRDFAAGFVNAAGVGGTNLASSAFVTNGPPDGRAVLDGGPNTAVLSTTAEPGETASIPDGRSAFVYSYGGNVYMRFYTNLHLPFGSEISLGTGSEPTIAAIADDRYAVVWTTADANFRGIRAVVVDGHGGVITPSFQVNQTTTLDQQEPSVTALGDGRYVISWTDYSANGGDVKARAFNEGGVAQSDEYVVHAATTGTQNNSDLIGRSSGGGVTLGYQTGATTATTTSMLLIDNVQVGGAGADGLTGTAQNDWLVGGDGADTLVGAAGQDLLEGGLGADILWGGAGNDTLNGNEGDDVVSGQDGSDILYGFDGNDVLVGGAGLDVLVGGLGNDTYYVDNGSDQIIENAGEGTDTVFSSSDFVLPSGVEILSLQPGASIGWGNELSNSIFDAGQRVTVYAGAGNDLVIMNGLGSRAEGQDGDDTLWDGGGDGILLGQDGADALWGRAGNDTLYGGLGNDTMVGDVGADNLWGEDGDDVAWAGDGDDLVVGGSGNDTLRGEAGNDTLWGGAGNDVLIGGAGNDVIWSEGGSDTIILETPTGFKFLQDFDPAQDTLLISAAAFGISAIQNGTTFVSGPGTGPSTASATLLFNTSTLVLAYDPDGTGAAGAIQIAQFFAPVTADDFGVF